MTGIQKIIASGTLEENGDTWFLRGNNLFTLLDIPILFDDSLQHKTVSVIGKMGFPDSAPGIMKLIVDKLISHEAIAIRAFGIFKSGAGGSQDDQWFQAERELLTL
jgi:hypothetical protein